MATFYILLETGSVLAAGAMATLQLALQKTSSIRMFEQPRQAVRALVGMGKPVLQQPRPPDFSNARADFKTGENFMHLKLTAERMLQEQACVKSDLEISNAKLQKTEEQLRMLESKLQEVCNENAMLRVKHKEDTKLWNGLESKLSSTNAFFDQITETLHSLESQVEQAESNKKHLEEELETRDSEILNDFNSLRHRINELEDRLQEGENNLCQVSLKRDEAERAAVEIQRQSEMELEAKQAEHANQLAEFCQRHDQEVSEIQRQSEANLEAKQAEFAKHLAEVSQRHDQEMNDMRRTYEAEREETISEERRRAESELESTRNKYEQLLLKERESAAHNLAAADKAASEIRRQTEIQLEAKQAEIAKHLKELSQRNDQAMNDIKRQYESETREAISKERRKAESELESIKNKYEQLMLKERESAIHTLESLRTEHAISIKKLQESHEQEMKTATSKTVDVVQKNHQEALEKMQKEINDMRERYEAETKEIISKERSKAESELESAKIKHEQLRLKEHESAAHNLESLQEEHAKLIEKLHEGYKQEMKLAASKIDDLQKKYQDVLSEMEKLKNSQAQNLEVAVPSVQMLSVEKEPETKDANKTESLTHSKKVTQHEYKVATYDRKKKLTKGKRTRSTLETSVDMDEGNDRKRAATPSRKQVGRTRASAGGDLFGAGCLDPYAFE